MADTTTKPDIKRRIYQPVLDQREFERLFHDPHAFEFECFCEDEDSNAPEYAEWRANGHSRIKIKETFELYKFVQTQRRVSPDYTNYSAYLKTLFADFNAYYKHHHTDISLNTLHAIEKSPENPVEPSEFHYLRNLHDVKFNGCYMYEDRKTGMVCFVIPDLPTVKKRLDGEFGMLQPVQKKTHIDQSIHTEKDPMKHFLCQLEYRNIWFRVYFFRTDTEDNLTPIYAWRDLTTDEAKALRTFDEVYRKELTKQYFPLLGARRASTGSSDTLSRRRSKRKSSRRSRRKSMGGTIHSTTEKYTEQQQTWVADYFNALVEYPSHRDQCLSASYYFKNPISRHLQDGWRFFNTFFFRQLLHRIVESDCEYNTITKEMYVNRVVFEKYYQSKMTKEPQYNLQLDIQKIVENEWQETTASTNYIIPARRREAYNTHREAYNTHRENIYDRLYAAFDCYKFHMLNEIATEHPTPAAEHPTPTVEGILKKLVSVVCNDEVARAPSNNTERIATLTVEACRLCKTKEVYKYLCKMMGAVPDTCLYTSSESVRVEEACKKLFKTQTYESLLEANETDVKWSSQLDVFEEMWFDLYYWSYVFETQQGFDNWQANEQTTVYSKLSRRTQRLSPNTGCRKQLLTSRVSKNGKTRRKSQTHHFVEHPSELQPSLTKPDEDLLSSLKACNIMNVNHSFGHLYTITVVSGSKTSIIQMNAKSPKRLCDEYTLSPLQKCFQSSDIRSGFVSMRDDALIEAVRPKCPNYMLKVDVDDLTSIQHLTERMYEFLNHYKIDKTTVEFPSKAFLLRIVNGTQNIWDAQYDVSTLSQYFPISDDRCTCVVPDESVSLQDEPTIRQWTRSIGSQMKPSSGVFMGWRIPHGYRHQFCRNHQGHILPLSLVLQSYPTKDADETKKHIIIDDYQDIKDASQYTKKQLYNLQQQYLLINRVLRKLHIPPNSCLYHCASGEIIPHARIQCDNLSRKDIYGHFSGYITVDRIGYSISLSDLIHLSKIEKLNDKRFDYMFRRG